MVNRPIQGLISRGRAGGRALDPFHRAADQSWDSLDTRPRPARSPCHGDAAAHDLQRQRGHCAVLFGAGPRDRRSVAFDDARRGADEIVATWREVREIQFFIDNANLDFNHGLSGTAFTLAQVWQATGDVAYRDAALAITRYIVEAARPVGAGVD